MKKLILISTLTAHLLAGGNINTSAATVIDTEVTTKNLPTQERTWYEVALLKPETSLTDEELRNRVIYANIIGAAVVTVWGTAFWDYFTTAPRAGDEGWFGKES